MKPETLEALLDEVRLLWHQLVQLGEALHRAEPVTLGMRAVLEFLLLQGPATVPQVARKRLVSRQHIQGLVSELAVRRLVTLAANPAHKRSALVALTTEGERTIRRMRKREARLLDQAQRGIGRVGLRQATRTLRVVRGALAGGER